MSDKKISQLTATTTPGGTDVMPIVQSSVTKKITFANLKAGILNSGSLTSGVIPYWNGTNLVDSWLSRETAGLILTTGKKIRTGATNKTNIEFGAGGDEFWLTTDGGTEAESALYMSPTQAELGFGNYGAGLKLEAALTTLRNTTELRGAAPIIWLYDPNDTSVGEYYAAADEAGMYTDTNSILVSETAVAGSTNYIQVRNAKVEIKHGTRIDFASPIVNFNNLTASTVVYLDASKNIVSLAAGSNGDVLTLAGGLPTWAAGGSGVTSVSGTANRITSSGGSTPAIDIAATYVGQASITTVGTISTGTWNGSLVGSTYGGTGVNNGSSTITIGGNVTFSGAYTFTGALTGNTSVTFPTSGTLATLAGTETFTNKSGNNSQWTNDACYIYKYCHAGSSSLNPADSTSYYLGTAGASISSTAGVRDFKFQFAKTITTATLNILQATNGSNETVTVYLRNSTSGTDYALGTFTSDFGLNTSTSFLFTGLSIATNTTDKWTIKLTTPAFATNPTTWSVSVELY